MSERDSQGRSDKSGGGDVKEGNFAQMGNEFLEKLLEFDLTKNELRIAIYFMRQLPGWRACFRPFSINQFISGTRLPKQKICLALASMISKGVLTKKKVQGLRTPLYGFNQETFERVVIGEPITQWDENSKVIDLVTFKVIKSGTLRVSQSDTFKNRRTATIAASEAPKYTSNKVLNIISLELRNFLASQPRSTKARWERFLVETLRRNPGDETLLSLAISLVHKERRDLLGTPIHSSVIGLFEKCDWQIMKCALEAKLKREKEDEEKKKRKEEINILATERKKQLDKDLEEAVSSEIAKKEIGKILSLIKG